MPNSNDFFTAKIAKPIKILYICTMFTSCDEVIKSMDEAGKKGTPFLFGFDFELRKGFFVANPMRQASIFFDINGATNARESIKSIPQFHFRSYPQDFETYKKRFSHVMDGLHQGDSYLTNLTLKTPIETSLSLEEIFTFSRAMYRLYIPNEFVCFSPERFVKIANGKIFSHPMKGTIDADLENAEQIILNDYKETAEHNTIVDLIRNDLSRVSSQVKVNRFRYIDTLQLNNGRILQVSSEIEGTLPDDYAHHIGSLFYELLPAGSVSGAPKKATLHIIGEAENETRGFYTGVAGYFDGEMLDSGVLIRFIEQQGNDLFFRSGGGVTVNSVCENEYREAIQKVYVPFQSSSSCF